MSYEGYTQVLCAKGHHRDFNCYGYDSWRSTKCHCGARWVWRSNVNETNGVEPGEKHCPGYVELEKDKATVTETCKECGHVSVLEEETFKIPVGVGALVEGE